MGRLKNSWIKLLTRKIFFESFKSKDSYNIRYKPYEQI